MVQMQIRSYTDAELKDMLVPLTQWKPFPKATERSEWDRLLQASWRKTRAEELIKACGALSNDPWPTLAARRYADFHKNGNRDQYEKPYFERRSRLMRFALSEACQYQGAFIEDLIDGIWAICEETSWCLPAHAYPNNLGLAMDSLPRSDRHIVDLFASQTAYCLAMVSYLLADELDAYSPAIRQRMHKAICDRVIDPVIDQRDFHWLKFNFNWNPWCSGNSLGAALFILEDQDRLIQMVQVVLESSRAFFTDQLADGGCSEGPGYWGVSPGMYLVLFDLLHSRSKGQINLFAEPMVQKMGQYIRKVHLDGEAFATFADCPHNVTIPSGAVYRYATHIQDQEMQQLALYSASQWNYATNVVQGQKEPARDALSTAIFHNWFWLPDDINVAKTDKSVFQALPDLHVWNMRENTAPLQGLVLGCKGGHNGEHHNHNDVGHFIALANGHRFILDVGTGTYTQKNFSASSFDIWYKRGTGHNTPVINGYEQVSGGDRRAKVISAEHQTKLSKVHLDISDIYPTEAKVKSASRCFEMDRERHEIRITDHIICEKLAFSIEIHLLCKDPVKIQSDGLIISHEHTSLRVNCSQLDSISTEGFDFSEDAQMNRFFGQSLQRIILHASTASNEWTSTMTLSIC